jgi:hypothetical protein
MFHGSAASAIFAHPIAHPKPAELHDLERLKQASDDGN